MKSLSFKISLAAASLTLCLALGELGVRPDARAAGGGVLARDARQRRRAIPDLRGSLLRA